MKREKEPGGEYLPINWKVSTICYLIRSIKDHFNRATQAQRNGDWALYGQEISEVEKLLENIR